MLLKKKTIPKYIIDDIEIFSDFDEKTMIEKIQMEKDLY